jgi:glutathione synthase/RimK-type ligase-like ATP-grasp enzyme
MSNFITEKRALIEAVKNSSKKFGITATFLSDGWLIRLQKNGRSRFIYVYGFDINSQASAAIATDKVAAYQLLTDNGVAGVPHYLLSSVLDTNIDTASVKELFKSHKSLVIKPNKGSRGELVAKCNNLDEVLAMTKGSPIPSWAASPFLDISRELRLVVLDGSIVLAYEKRKPQTINGLKMYNLNLGATVQGITVDTVDRDIQTLATKAMDTIGLRLGAVDIVFDTDNTPYVLEINSGFSLEHYALSSPDNRHEVISFYELVIQKLFED